MVAGWWSGDVWLPGELDLCRSRARAVRNPSVITFSPSPLKNEKQIVQVWYEHVQFACKIPEKRVSALDASKGEQLAASERETAVTMRSRCPLHDLVESRPTFTLLGTF